MATARPVDVQSPVPGIQIIYDFINEPEEAYLLEVRPLSLVVLAPPRSELMKPLPSSPSPPACVRLL